MRTPIDKRVIFTLYSHPVKEANLRWKAHLTFEPASTDDTDAVLEIIDGVGEPIHEGTFQFAGSSIVIANGRGLLPCRSFVSGKHDGAIWLHRKGLPPIPGALTFE